MRCPICKFDLIRLKYVHTCGCKDCMKSWRKLSASERIKIVRDARLADNIEKPYTWSANEIH